MLPFAILECTNEVCRLRFPLNEGDRPQRACPLCGAALVIVARGQRTREENGEDYSARAGRPGLALDLLLDNVRSAFNVGSILRSAEGAGVRHVFLCGITPTPDHPRVARTALGAERAIGWSHARNGLLAAQERLAAGARLWALEEGAGATSLRGTHLPSPVEAPGGLLLVAGNEVTGVDPGLLDLCHATVCLPMYGRKRSLNVAVATGIALHLLAAALEPDSAPTPLP